jgi:DNA mismatch endonuclease (patch repair protein)
MSRIKGKDTKPEKILRSLLHEKGFRYRVHDNKFPGCPDIVLPKYKSVIFVNGCFWHRHPGCGYATTPKSRQEFWQQKFVGNVERDRKNIELLKKKGWHPIVVWECELKKNADALLKKISTWLYHQYAVVEGA